MTKNKFILKDKVWVYDSSSSFPYNPSSSLPYNPSSTLSRTAGLRYPPSFMGRGGRSLTLMRLISVPSRFPQIVFFIHASIEYTHPELQKAIQIAQMHICHKKWPKNDLKLPKIAQKWPRIDPKMTQNGPKITPGFTHFFRNFFLLKKRFRKLFRF